MTEEALYAFRDPYGVRPLVLGKLDGIGWVVASRDVRARHRRRRVRARRRARRDRQDLATTASSREQAVPAEKPSLCMFEFVYFARPDSRACTTARSTRRAERMGAALAREAPVEADLVMGVPDSGIPAAIGFAHGERHPLRRGARRRTATSGRTFISPSQMMRQQGIRLKLNPLQARDRGQAARRRRRLDRARQHHAQARRSCCARPARPRCTCASRRRR